MDTFLNLNGEWKLGVIDDADMPQGELRSYDESLRGLSTYKGMVPGNYELDLEREGAIPDLHFDDNLKIAHKMEHNHALYSKKFSLEEVDPRLELVFGGIDTVADVFVNGTKLGSVRNMHIEHRFFVSPFLRKGENEIFVHIKPITLEARKIDDPFYTFALGFNYESINWRKGQYMFGWGIFPRMVTMGLWKDVYLEHKPEVGIKQTYLWTRSVDRKENSAVIELFWELELGHEHTRDFTVVLDGKCGESSFHAEEHIWAKTGRIRNIKVDNAQLWWPRPAGPQNLYDVTVSLMQNGEKVGEKKISFGIRTMELIRTDVETEDRKGEFCFRVNGQKIFILGTNWVPLTNFPSRDRERLGETLRLTEDIGCNMIRIWGGGYYEDDELFDLCDRDGVLIWQDFMMGCGQFPQNEDFKAQMHEEAAHIIKRYRQHPSLALWAGDNECDVACDWYGNVTDPTLNALTREVLPYEVRMHDPVRTFLPSSPYVSKEAWEVLRTEHVEIFPEKHLWGPRTYFKGPFYKDTPAHFASEIGYHGCTNVESMKRFLKPENLWPIVGNESCTLHGSSPCLDAEDSYLMRNPLMGKQIRILFGVEPDNLEEFCLLSQISQAEAMKFFVERFRTEKWERTGIIWWNIQDGTPQFSDAIVDYYGGKKISYGYIKRAQEPVAILEAEDRNQFCLVNDLSEDERVEWRVLTSDGRTIRTGITDCPAFGKVDIMPVDKSLTDMFRLEWTVNGESHFNHYAVIEGQIDRDRYIVSAERNGLY